LLVPYSIFDGEGLQNLSPLGVPPKLLAHEGGVDNGQDHRESEPLEGVAEMWAFIEQTRVGRLWQARAVGGGQ
jgi:hypothetical protein